MNVVNYEKLKEILRELWNRIKDKFIEDVTFDDSIDVVTNKPKNTLKKIINGQEQEIVTKLVREWQDLEHVTEYKITNIFNKDLIIDNQYHNVVGGLNNDNNWCRYTVPCEPNEVLSVVKKTRDSQVFTFLNSDGTRVEHGNYPPTTVNGWEHYVVTVPSNTDIKMVSVNIHKPDNPLDDNTVMIYKGNEAPTTEYYPFADGRTVIVDGSKVALTFDPLGSNLTSTTTHNAIKELDKKIANAGGGTVTSVNNKQPNDQGEVTVEIADIQGLQGQLDGKVNKTEVGNSANKIPRLNNQGKLVDDIIPELAITRIVDATDQADALAKVNSRDIQVGDSVRLTGEENKVYQYTGVEPGNFANRFIEISLGDATVRTVNGQAPAFDGEVTVNAGQIRAFVGNNVKSVQDHMNDINTTLSNTKTLANENRARINVLETKQPYYNVGDIVPTFKNSGNGYKVAGCEFMYCGTSRVLNRADYPDFCDVLGYSTATSRFDTPAIRDESILITNGKYATRRYYVCIKNK